MTPKKLKDWITSLTQDIDFMYQGHECTINPFSRQDIAMAIDGDNKNYSSVEDLMSDPRFDGKPLNQIAEQIELT